MPAKTTRQTGSVPTEKKKKARASERQKRRSEVKKEPRDEDDASNSSQLTTDTLNEVPPTAPASPEALLENMASSQFGQFEKLREALHRERDEHRQLQGAYNRLKNDMDEIVSGQDGATHALFERIMAENDGLREQLKELKNEKIARQAEEVANARAAQLRGSSSGGNKKKVYPSKTRVPCGNCGGSYRGTYELKRHQKTACQAKQEKMKTLAGLLAM